MLKADQPCMSPIYIATSTESELGPIPIPDRLSINSRFLIWAATSYLLASNRFNEVTSLLTLAMRRKVLLEFCVILSLDANLSCGMDLLKRLHNLKTGGCLEGARVRLLAS